MAVPQSALLPVLHLLFLGFLSPSQSQSAAQFDVSACGQSKQCLFGGCSNPQQKADLDSCATAFSVGPDMGGSNSSVQIELFSKKSDPEVRYIAVGFSEDNQMGDDSVTYCVQSGDSVQALLSMNSPEGKSNMAAPPGTEEGTLELLESGATGDWLYCKVRQHSNPSVQKNLARPNLGTPFFILLANGPASEARVLDIHSLEPNSPSFPFVSAQQMVPLGVARQIAAGQRAAAEAATGNQHKDGLDLVDAHGLLMLLAWIGLTAVAIYSARYMRNAWAHTTVMGLKIWFHIHRTLNFLSVLAMVSSIVLILLFKQRWTGPWFGQEHIGPGGWHSLAGAVSVLLALSQPFGALFRCGADHPRRPVFNWQHRITGLLAVLAAGFAFFFAVSTFKRHFALADFALWLLLLFYIAVGLLVLISEAVRLLETREQNRISAIEMQSRHRGSTPSDAYYYHTHKGTDSKLASARKLLFAVFASLCAGVALILVLLVLFH